MTKRMFFSIVNGAMIALFNHAIGFHYDNWQYWPISLVGITLFSIIYFKCKEDSNDNI
jgi:hypothetical protein